MRNKRVSGKQKERIVRNVVQGESVSRASRKYGISRITIYSWLYDERINPDKDFILRHNEDLERKREKRKLKQGDPFPNGVIMASKRDPEELSREVKDLRKKNAYLEDKVAYLEALNEILKEGKGETSKKKDSRQSKGSCGKEGKT